MSVLYVLYTIHRSRPHVRTFAPLQLVTPNGCNNDSGLLSTRPMYERVKFELIYTADNKHKKQKFSQFPLSEP